MRYRSIEQISLEFKQAKRKYKTWRRTADYLSDKYKVRITAGMALRIARDKYEPSEKNQELRHALGLPIYKLAPVCKWCGDVHMPARCPNRRKKSTKLIDYSTEELAYMLVNRQPMY